MGQIQITVSELEDKKGQLLILHSEAMEEMEQIDAVVRELEAQWEGDASKAFQACYKLRCPKLVQALATLKGIINSLDRIIQTYSETEAANTRLASQ